MTQFITELTNDGGVCETAPGTPGLRLRLRLQFVGGKEQKAN